MAKRDNKLVRDAEEKKQERGKREEERKARNKIMSKKESKLSEMQKVFVLLKKIEDDEKMSNEKKKARFNDVEKLAEDRLQKLNVKRQNIRKEIEGRGESIDAERLAKLQEEGSKLDEEAKVLEDFSNIRDQVLKIMSKIKKIEEKKADAYEKAKKELAQVKEKIAKVNDLDKQLAELDKYSEEFCKKEKLTKEDKQKNLENTKKYNKILKEKQQMEQGDYNKLLENLEIANNKVNSYEKGASQEDKAIKKCNWVWKMLAKGKTWDEIENMASNEEPKKAYIESKKANTETKKTQKEPEKLDIKSEKIDVKSGFEKKNSEPIVIKPIKDNIRFVRFEDKNKFTKFLSEISFMGIGKRIKEYFNERYAIKERASRGAENGKVVRKGKKDIAYLFGEEEFKKAENIINQEKNKKVEEANIQEENKKIEEASIQGENKILEKINIQEENKKVAPTLSQKRDVFVSYLRDMVESKENIKEEKNTELEKYITKASKVQVINKELTK